MSGYMTERWLEYCIMLLEEVALQSRFSDISNALFYGLRSRAPHDVLCLTGGSHSRYLSSSIGR